MAPRASTGHTAQPDGSARAALFRADALQRSVEIPEEIADTRDVGAEVVGAASGAGAIVCGAVIGTSVTHSRICSPALIDTTRSIAT